MENSISVTHCGVEITYNEETNRFHFELRGRKRSAESLAKAREAIERPEPNEKPFTPIRAVHWSSYGAPSIVEVTSIAENSRYEKGLHVWMRTDDGRRKCSASDLLPFNDETNRSIAEYKAIGDQIGALNKQQAEIRSKLKRLVIE